MSDEPLVRVEHVSKKFCRSLKRSLWYGLQDFGAELRGQSGEGRLALRQDEFLAVDDVSFELRRGECLGLVGANGAGKSTLLKMLNGLVRPDAGRIEMRGRVGALIELGAGFNPILTGRENVYVNGAVLGMTKQEIDARFDEIVEFSGIGEFIDSPVRNYSSGMRVRLGFAVAAHLEPDVLLIDEVLAVGDASFRTKCVTRISELLKRSTVVFVSHQMAQVGRIATSLIVLNGGRVSFSGAHTAKGIESYLAALPRPPRESAPLGHLSLSNFTMRSGDAVGPSAQISVGFGSELRVSFELTHNSRIAPHFVELTVVDIEGRAVAHSDSRRSAFVLSGERERSRIELVFPALCLNTGRYFLSLYFFELGTAGERGALLHSELHIGSLEVRDQVQGFFSVHLDATWSALE